jgi:hypothetical protein
MSEFKTPYSLEDEFLCFNKLINRIKEAYSDLVNEFFHGLDENEKLKLRDILNTKRHINGNRELVRRIVKLKRKISN